jgi:phosphatidylserine/phosphatidylglycerophosphate/cardiolipin synthase-like enzyme
VHAKLIVVENRQALVGSMNIDRSAFDLRRELGIMTDDPDPLDPSQRCEDDFPHDPDLMNE